MSIFKNAACRMMAVGLVAGGIGLGAGVAVAGQPQMEGALSALQSAQGYLNQVTQDKDGHAQSARKLVAKAIVQVEAGIAYGQAHGE